MSIYQGDVTGYLDRSDYLRKTSKDHYDASVRWAVFNSTPFLKVLGIDEMGLEPMQNLQAFGSATPKGQMLEFVGGGYQTGGSFFTERRTDFFAEPMDNYNPQYLEGGTQYAYTWCKQVISEVIPVEHRDDNVGGLVDIKVQKQEGMKQSMVTAFSRAILGSNNSSGYSSGAEGARVFTDGPGAYYNDLPNLLSVTNTRTVGGVAKTNSAWQCVAKAITDVGGGGEYDIPLLLRRSMLKGLNDTQVYAEAKSGHVGVCTQGFWQYYDRLQVKKAIADGGDTATSGTYDAAGIQHFMFAKNPVVWEPELQVPFGATANTECLYMIPRGAYKLSIKNADNFRFTGWEEPRAHDPQKGLVAELTVRYMPMMSAMRAGVIFYNLPANPD